MPADLLMLPPVSLIKAARACLPQSPKAFKTDACLSGVQEQEEKLASPMAATLSLEDMPTPAQEEGVDDNRALLDDVDWKAVALKVGTRSRVQCMIKWYRHLAPSMVTQGTPLPPTCQT